MAAAERDGCRARRSDVPATGLRAPQPWHAGGDRSVPDRGGVFRRRHHPAARRVLRGTAVRHHPASNHVSLRATATDTAGTTAGQTTISAYRLR
ncbi:hypothetical protein EF879_23300 [Micromonospora sp. HM5-17]|nr:hypothetical protein EF879_23300 [Micromonospora sp. HM5-17]